MFKADRKRSLVVTGSALSHLRRPGLITALGQTLLVFEVIGLLDSGSESGPPGPT